MLGAVALQLWQIASLQQVFMDTHSAFVFAAPPKQVTQSKVKLRGVRVVLNSFNEGVNRLILLLVEQKIQTSKVSLWRLPVFNPQLAQINAGGQPAERKRNW